MDNKKGILLLLLAAALLTGCAAGAGMPGPGGLFRGRRSLEVVELAREAVALAGEPAVNGLLLPEAPGTKVKKTAKATIDYSNMADGYVMVCFTAKSDKKLRAKVITPSTTIDYYQYVLTSGEWAVIPLSDGDGAYTIKVLENTTGSKYAVSASVTIDVKLSDEFAPFLRSNQYVDYAQAVNTLAKAAELVGEERETLKKVEKIYDFVVNGFTYDKEKAKTVQKTTGYLPVLDDVLEAKTGICFDYAALMTGMLRSQGIPCKLVVGYAGTAYHAWISVWTEEKGWVDGAIYFDGETWQRMDPTFASSGKGSEAIMKYIGDGKNYTAKQFY